MLNRIVLGMTAKQYRAENNIPASEPIRSHLFLDEAKLMDRLQLFDIGFVVAVLILNSVGKCWNIRL